MKKALSLVLAIMMVFALSTTAFAATTRVDVVGTVIGKPDPSVTPSYDNGWTATNFGDGKLPTTNIVITATAANIESRYAVDIEYDEMTLNIAGNAMVWDVTQLKYVPKTGGTATAKDTSFKVTVTNYSDQPVNLTAKITDGTKADDLILGYVAGTDGVVNGYTYTAPIAKNQAGATTAQTHAFQLTLTSTEWQKVTDFYMNEINSTGNTTVNVATLDITISK